MLTNVTRIQLLFHISLVDTIQGVVVDEIFPNTQTATMQRWPHRATKTHKWHSPQAESEQTRLFKRKWCATQVWQLELIQDLLGNQSIECSNYRPTIQHQIMLDTCTNILTKRIRCMHVKWNRVQRPDKVATSQWNTNNTKYRMIWE